MVLRLFRENQERKQFLTTVLKQFLIPAQTLKFRAFLYRWKHNARYIQVSKHVSDYGPVAKLNFKLEHKELALMKLMI